MTPPEDQNEARGLSGPRALIGALLGLLRAQAGVLIGLVVLLGVLEVGLRMVRPELSGQVFDATTTGGHPIVFSEQSFRVPQGQGQGQGAASGSPVILGLGDSTTFGTGVGAEETWPLRLAAHLDADAPAANAGFPGGGVRQLEHGLETLWSTPKPPEVVLLLVTGNMVSFTEFLGTRPPRDLMRRVRAAERRTGQAKGLKARGVALLQSSALWKATTNTIEIGKYGLGLLDHRTDPAAPLGPLLAYGWQQPDLPATHGTGMWGIFEEELGALHAQVRAQGACLVIGFLPPRFTLSDQRADNLKFVPKHRLTEDAGARVAALAEGLSVPFVDMGPALSEARAGGAARTNPLFVPNDYTHLDAAGHDVVAQRFARVLNGAEACAPR